MAMRPVIAQIMTLMIALPLQAETLHRALILPKPLASDFDAVPRLAGSDPVAMKINQVLQHAQDVLLFERQECLRNFAAEFAAGWTITLNGPHFLSILGSTFTWCGWAHPDADHFVLFFDLNTGQQLDPITLLPRDLRPDKPKLGQYRGDETSGKLYLPLKKLYLSRAIVDTPLPKACLDSFQSDDKLHFLIWPDAKEQALMMMPDGMAYAQNFCAEIVSLPLDLLRHLPTAPRLIEALGG
ncbi:MAG: hypothetical protein WCO04_02295 [Pseudomonadota bacterium]